MVYQLSEYQSNKTGSKTGDSRSEWGNVLPPQVIEAEEALLGGILLDPDAIIRVVGLVQPADFYLGAHRLLFETMLKLNAAGTPCDLFQVSMAAPSPETKKLVTRLIEKTVHSVYVEDYAKAIAAKARRRRVIEVCNKLSDEAHGSSSNDELDAEVERQLFELVQGKQTARGLRSLSDFLIEEMAELERLADGGDRHCFQTGFYDLDAMLGGLQPKRLYIVAGRPGTGKSAFSGSLLRNVAAIHNKPVALFSLEMGGGEVARRLISAEASIESSRLMSGAIAPQDWEPIGHTMSSLSALPIFIDDSTRMTPQEVKSQCVKLAAQHGELGAIVVDYLHLMIDGDEDEQRLLGRYTRAFKKMAGELNVPVIVLSQLNRQVENQQNKRPANKDLRQSGSIEQDADVIMMLYRDELHNPETPDRGIAEVIITKHRNGPVGTVKLLFEPQFTRFRNLAAGGKV